MMKETKVKTKEIGGGRYSAMFSYLKKLPLEDRLKIDTIRSKELGHDPKKLLHSAGLKLFEQKLGFGYDSDESIGSAKAIMEKYGLSLEEVRPVAIERFSTLLYYLDRTSSAICVAKTFELSGEDVKKLEIETFGRELKKQSGMPDAEKLKDYFKLSVVDIMPEALKAYESKIGDDPERSLLIAVKYRLGDDKIREAAIARYEQLIRYREYSKAKEFVAEYGLKDIRADEQIAELEREAKIKYAKSQFAELIEGEKKSYEYYAGTGTKPTLKDWLYVAETAKDAGLDELVMKAVMKVYDARTGTRLPAYAAMQGTISATDVMQVLETYGGYVAKIEEMKMKVIMEEYERCMISGKVKDAEAWLEAYGIDVAETRKKIGTQTYDRQMKGKLSEEALKTAEVFGLETEKITATAAKECDKLIFRKEFDSAAKMAKKYGLGEKVKSAQALKEILGE